MSLVDREKLERSNTEISHYLGVVVDNKDPEFRGRAKIRVFGLFDQKPTLPGSPADYFVFESPL